MVPMRFSLCEMMLVATTLVVGCGPAKRDPVTPPEATAPAATSPSEIVAVVTNVEPDGERVRVTLDKGNEHGVTRTLRGCVVRDNQCASTATLIRIDKTESVVVVAGGAAAVGSGDVVRLYRAD